MSAFNAPYIVKFAGKRIPQEAFEKVMEEHKSMTGFAAALQVDQPDGTDQDQVLECFSQPETPPISEIMKQHDSYEEDLCIFVFADYPKKFGEESNQPFVILKSDEDEGDPILIAAIDGNFPSHDADGQDGAVIVADILRGTLSRFLKTSSDMNEMMEAIMTDPAIPRMVKGLYKDRCNIFLLAENGQTYLLGDNPDRVEFDWGWMSKACGYSEKKTETLIEKVKGVASQVRTFGSGRRTDAKAAPATETSAGSLQSASKEQTALHQKSNDDETHVVVSSPAGCTKDQGRTFYKRANDGIVPTGFKNHPEIKILRSRWEKLIADPAFIRDTGMKELKETEIEKIVSSNVTEASANEIIPKAPPAELKLHKEVFMKRPTVVKIVNEGRGIIDPKRQQETEDTYATYPEIAGLSSIMDLYAYDQTDWEDLIKRTPVLARIAIANLVGECIRRTPDAELNPVAAKPSASQQVKVTGTTGRTTPAPTTASSPPVKSGGVRTFGKGK